MAKYKLKTHKGTQKRISISGSGKIMRTKGGKSHLRRKRSARAKRLYDEMLVASTSDARRLRKLIPYGV
ncbi:MAG: 50S ribosomal protein L35 [Chloroflexi bacterium]|nr:50S ribosomal protein L35 [Chloroflexota bacterium]MDA8189209.1 50S ribosomal protein L35 [Dehalococcoidales bacterium]